MARPTLDEVLAEADPFGLLDVAPPLVAGAGGQDAQILAELRGFIERHGRPPRIDADAPFQERLLATHAKRLAAKDPAVGALLVDLPAEPPKTIDEIADDEMRADDDIFDLKHVAPRTVLEQPEYVGSRRPCEEFEEFRPLFEAAVADLSAKRREARKFAREQEIDAGQFFILKGMMAYVAEAGEPFQDRLGNRNRRLRVIFDNGTEGDPLLRSFASLLYNDEQGRRITDPVAGPLFRLEPQDGDMQTGHIYAARTLSTAAHIAEHAPRMLKIGVTSGDVDRRIADAVNDPTFLLAPARIVTRFTLYNVNRVHLERLLHRFFDPARVDIEIVDRFGKPVRPREWFYVTPDQLSEVVRRIQDGSITRCYFDPGLGIVDLGSV